jgi:hypothetical protein
MTPPGNSPADDVGSDVPADGQPLATPDEDGPHDVPDDQVIEKTLPTVPLRDGGNRPG